MSDLAQLLESVADQAQPTTLGSAAAIRAAGDRRTRRNRVTSLALVAVAVAAAVVLAAALAPDRTGTPAPVHPFPVTPQPVAPKADGGLAFLVNPADAGVEVARDPSSPGGPFLTSAAFGAARQHCDVVSEVWSPDGTRLAILAITQAATRPATRSVAFVAEGGAVHRLFRCPGPPDATCDWQYASDLKWSPDGRKLALSSQQVPYVYDFTSRSVKGVDCAGCHGTSPFFSPDGRWLGYLTTDGVDAVPVAGGTPRRLSDVGQATSAAWSPDGTHLAIGAGDGVHVVDLTTGDPVPQQTFEQGAAEGPGAPAWSPDGRRIAMFSTPGSNGAFVPEIWLMDADGHHQRRLHRFPCCVGDWTAPTWSPDGRRVAMGLTISDRTGRHPRPGGVIVLDAATGRVLHNYTGYGPVTWRGLTR